MKKNVQALSLMSAFATGLKRLPFVNLIAVEPNLHSDVKALPDFAVPFVDQKTGVRFCVYLRVEDNEYNNSAYEASVAETIVVAWLKNLKEVVTSIHGNQLDFPVNQHLRRGLTQIFGASPSHPHLPHSPYGYRTAPNEPQMSPMAALPTDEELREGSIASLATDMLRKFGGGFRHPNDGHISTDFYKTEVKEAGGMHMNGYIGGGVSWRAHEVDPVSFKPTYDTSGQTISGTFERGGRTFGIGFTHSVVQEGLNEMITEAALQAGFNAVWNAWWLRFHGTNHQVEMPIRFFEPTDNQQ